jgi:hypothetical protein
MSAPRKAYINQLVKIQPEESLACTSELNPAPEWVTVHREARGMEHRAATKVKGLSSEIADMSVADAVHRCGRRNSDPRYGESIRARRSLRPRHDVKRLIWELGRPCRFRSLDSQKENPPLATVNTHPESGMVERNNPKREGSSTAGRESDQFVVAKKQGNACGAKGLTRIPRSGDTFLRPASRGGKGNVTRSMTRSTEGEEVFLKSRMRENRTYGSVRGFIVDSERRWL